ncbi:hypothetical protein Riv7116_3417 [Rivularia sp. PCC 7116]|uniref:hypothetical protein n=1 Tax=Rivularia sp. PCC 7116 TaxID=373994 RepID=UPI00029ED9DE|nr:hypothetical protein [Rivularia sp. PCC 7116]AFY55873.1 hypothetical protein Riv7116_3417 [Rivularia sp. PCC 7116]
MNEDNQTRIALKIEGKIRQAEDDLVKAIVDALRDSEYLKSGDKKLEESQFNNLLRVADTSESPEVIKNFIFYQVGRDEKWGRGKKSLAAKIVNDIDGNLQNKASEIAKEAFTGEVPKEEIKKIQMQLIRLYLGYGSRYLKYLNTVNDPKNKSTAII